MVMAMAMAMVMAMVMEMKRNNYMLTQFWCIFARAIIRSNPETIHGLLRTTCNDIHTMMRHTICLVIILLVSGCNSGVSNAGQAVQNDTVRVVTPQFKRPDVPAMISDPNLRNEFSVKHYWDYFDFADTAYIPTPEITEQAWVDYLDLLFRLPLNMAQEEMKTMMSKSAQNSKNLFLYFTGMAEKYLYEPNSPLLFEELYIPVLEVMIQTSSLDESEKIRPQHLLEWANKNRMGTKAANFQYIDITGKSGSLYQLAAEYTLLFFSDPACPSCKANMESIRNSQDFNKLISARRLIILSVYSEQDLDEWKAHYTNYPANWINGYDQSFTIRDKYDIRASPTMYLLDRDKIVLLKDAPFGQIANYFAYNQ